MRACFLLLIAVCLITSTIPAMGQVLYENGPISGQTDAWTINLGFVVSNSFTISSGSSTVTGLSFGVWLFAGDTLQSAEVSLTSEAFGGITYFDQQVNLAASNCFLNPYGYDICEETGSFNGPTLVNGTYWLNLLNAQSTLGDPVYWDQNSGIGCHSEGCPSLGCDNGCLGSMPSEAFSILGSTGGTGTVPEPPTLVLVGGGFFAIVETLRRRLHL